VKSAQPLASTLILTGHGSFENAVAAIRAGADDFMTKPVDRASLVMKARELLEAASGRKAQDREVVLAIGAHPDDVEIGCGGILLGHAARRDSISILTLTAGEQGGEIGLRATESAAAAAMLGARLFHTDLVDTSVSDGGVTIGTIQRVIDEVEPTVIYTHTKHDVHQDHRSVHAATLVAARRVPRIYCYQSPSTTVDFHPTRFVPIDEQIERKLDVIQAYGSQTVLRAYLEPDLLRATARYWSRFAQSTFVEPLEIARETERTRRASEAATLAVLEEAAA
jgi:LmbE family N-acetylglucosaminyl deacetylase